MTKSLIKHFGRIDNPQKILSENNFDWSVMGWWNGFFIVTAESENSITLNRNTLEFDKPPIILSKEGFNDYGKPLMALGESVKIKENNKLAKVYSVMWHFSKECFYYLLDYGDRKSKRRYYEYELQKLEDAQ